SPSGDVLAMPRDQRVAGRRRRKNVDRSASAQLAQLGSLPRARRSQPARVLALPRARRSRAELPMITRSFTFYYDVVCPYAYLASTQVEAMARRAQATIEWVPILLGGVFKAIGQDQQPASRMPAAKTHLNA